jgi:Cyclic nucleotide-binding domain
MTWTNLVPYLANLAALLMLIGFTFRDPLKLRSFAIFSSLCFILYFFLVSDVPLWTAIISAAAIIAVNIYMMWQIIHDRKMFRLSAEEMMLFARLPGLTPGQYKQVLAIAEWHNPQVSMQLTKLGEMPKALYYVLEGRVEVNRDGKRFSVGPHAFIGELAFLRAKPASATTFANVGALIVSWEQEALHALMKSNDGVRKAFDNMLSIDMADKMARNAAPILEEQSA